MRDHYLEDVSVDFAARFLLKIPYQQKNIPETTKGLLLTLRAMDSA